jgi:diguanylate cyclase (GGDEF)-like protein
MSLRLRIVLLVLLATLTPAALFAFYVYQQRQNEIVEAKQSLQALGRYAAQNLSDKINGTVQMLHGLSRAPDLDTADKAACSAFLRDVLRRYPQYTGLLTIRPDGQLHCDSLGTGRTLDLNDRAYFRQARASAEPAFEVVFGRLSALAVLQVAFPARDNHGDLKYVLLASLNLAQFSSRFAASSPLKGMEIVIWDSKGTVMARHPDDGPAQLAGKLLADSALYRFVRSEQSGDTAELAGPDGTRKIWALSVLPEEISGGMRVTLGIPREVLLAEADQDVRRALTNLAAASLLAILAALLFAELGIRRHIARIMATAKRQGAGDHAARIGAPYPRGELGALMLKLDATAASVQAQQVEIERNSGELLRINRTLRVLNAINSTIVRVRNRDELLAEACRIAAEEGLFPVCWVGILDRGTMEVEPVAWQGIERATLESVPRLLTDTGTIIGQALRERRPVVVNDIAAASQLVTGESALALGSLAFAAFPLIVSDEPVGVFVLHAREAGFFDAQEIRLLNELAGDIAFALEYIGKSERLDYLAYYDPLTGMANRALFHDRLSQLVAAAGRENRGIAVVLADIERFRAVNDTYGRQAGDELLKQVGARASRSIPDSRRMARIGADHFAFVIPDQSAPEDLARRIEGAHTAVFGEPFLVGGAELRLAARFGVALYPGDGADADALLRNAEAALKKAKAGGERYLFYMPEMSERAAEKLSLENKLRRALEQEEFVLHYQPKVDLETRRIAGVEALIRWQSPERGLVPPMQFIPLLEETGLILQVGAWALQRAARDHREWREAGLNAPRVAVNISPIQLRQHDFVQSLRQSIREGVAPTAIDVEITESLVMEDIEGNIRKLKEIRALGLGIAIDDFGTGYSSLAYLAKLPVQVLKIDRSFIIAMLNDRDTMTLVSTIISLAHSLRLKVVAEGVEEEEQAKLLRLLRCDEMQGYLVGRPVPNEALRVLLQPEMPGKPPAQL